MDGWYSHVTIPTIRADGRPRIRYDDSVRECCLVMLGQTPVGKIDVFSSVYLSNLFAFLKPGTTDSRRSRL